MPLYKDVVKAAMDALDELPSVCQGIGTLGQRMRHCKPGLKAKRAREIDAAYVKFNNQSAELSSKIRMALYFAMQEAK